MVDLLNFMARTRKNRSAPRRRHAFGASLVHEAKTYLSIGNPALPPQGPVSPGSSEPRRPLTLVANQTPRTPASPLIRMVEVICQGM